MYTSLRLALKGDAALIIKRNEAKYRNKGIEYLHSMKPIFDPKWPTAQHSQKVIEFYSFFRPPIESVDTYAHKFKSKIRALRYNNIPLSAEQAKHAFIQGLGAEFIPIKNMSILPPEFLTNDLDLLTVAARDQLARIMGNRAAHKHQQAALKSAATDTPAEKNKLSSKSSHDNGNTPTNTPHDTSNPRQPTGAQNGPTNTYNRPEVPPYQKEIMREIGFAVHTQARKNYWQTLT